MLSIILPVILAFNAVAYAVPAHLFDISIRTGFDSIHLHKLIAEREVLSLGRECSIKEFPLQTNNWDCDNDEKGVLCRTTYTCRSDGGREKRYAHMKGIENILAKEIRDKGKYQALETVTYSSKNGSYSLGTNYTPPAKNAPVLSREKTSKTFYPSQATAEEDYSSRTPRKEVFPEDSPTEDIPTEDMPLSSTALSEEEYNQVLANSSVNAHQFSEGRPYRKEGRIHQNSRPGEGKIMEFDLSLGWITDNNKGSLRTTHFAWTPKYRFDSIFMIGVDFGAQVLESTLVKDNYFIAIDGVVSGYFFVKPRTYIKISGGAQKWSGDPGGTHSLFTVGVGFELPKTISRLFIQYAIVGNDTKNKEFRIGFGISL